MSSYPMPSTPNGHGNKGLGCIPYWTMTEILKPKLSEDDFVLVRIINNYFIIPRWAHTKENHEDVKQQSLNNQKMIKELRTIWDDGEHVMFAENVTEIMETFQIW